MAVATRKTVCPMTSQEFFQRAEPLLLEEIARQLGGTLSPKQFSSGGFGFHKNGRVTLTVGGRHVTFQVGINVSAVNSKPQA